MQNLMRYSEYDILHDDSSAFSVDTQRERHCSNPTDRDDKQGLRAPLTFEGDRQSNGSRSSPPLAWTLVWGNTYSNIFGQYIPKSFQRWGWVMWDAARLEHTGAKELIMKQWEKWKEADSYDDPRQPFWSER